MDKLEPNEVRVVGEGTKSGNAPRNVPQGYISWAEHVEAWETYTSLWPGHSASKIAELGGFGYYELLDLLGHVPQTWRPQNLELHKNFIPPAEKLY